jgi:hypothetical protein
MSKYTATKTEMGYFYRSHLIEKRNDGSWSYRDYNKKGTTTFGNPSSHTQRFFTQLKFAKNSIDQLLKEK